MWAGLASHDASIYPFFSYEPPLPNMRNDENIQHVVARPGTSNGPNTGMQQDQHRYRARTEAPNTINVNSPGH